MKKLQLFLLIALMAGLHNNAVAQTDTARGTYYYFYPGSNIYSNQASNDYWYYDSTTTNWVEAKKLPAAYTINRQSKRTRVYYNGTEVWRDNALHIQKYGIQQPVPKGRDH